MHTAAAVPGPTLASASQGGAPLDLLRFLALSLEVHTDAVCCAVDDVERAIVESSTNDERLDALEEELADLLDRQRRLHAAHSVIALSQEERRRGAELRRSRLPLTQSFGEKRIQVSRPSSQPVAGLSAMRVARHTGVTGEDLTTGFSAADASTRGFSTGAPSEAATQLQAELEVVDAQVERLKSRIQYLDRYSLRGKLLELEKRKKAIKDVNLDDITAAVVDDFQFPAAVQALWGPPPALPTAGRPRALEASLAEHAAGKGSVVNHTNVDLLLARACQRLAGRATDALEALSSTSVTEDSVAAHVLGCMVYAGEFDASDGTDLAAVQALQQMPPNALSQLYDACVGGSVCEARLDERCFGARQTVLSAHDFCALPNDWATTQSLTGVALDTVLPPVRHLLAPRFTFADVAELRRLQARRVALQEKIVQLLVGGQEAEAEALAGLEGASSRDRTVAAARLAVADATPTTRCAHAWKTILAVSEES